MVAKGCIKCFSIAHKLAKTSRTTPSRQEEITRLIEGCLPGRGLAETGATPRRTLNNLPLMFTSTKEKPVLADTPANFLRFPQHPVYNFTGRTGTESKAGRRRWKNSQEYYYCDRLTISVWNARILEINCYWICQDHHWWIGCQRVQVLWSDWFRMTSLLRLFRKKSFRGAGCLSELA